MEKEKDINHRRDKILCILLGVCLGILIALLVVLIVKHKEDTTTTKTERIYYNSIEYGQENLVEKYDKKVLTSYEEYEKFVQNARLNSKIEEIEFSSSNYIVVYALIDTCGGNINGIKSFSLKNNMATIEIGYTRTCGLCAPEYKLYLVPVPKENSKIDKVEYSYVPENDIKCNENVAYKPLIYLYPPKETEVTIKVGHPENLTVTYPRYYDNWQVIASPDGTLKDSKTNRTYYGLYWEGIHYTTHKIVDGFVVKNEHIEQFLEEKLSILGLTERESNEFIIYWLPILKKSEYNLIRFASLEEINEIMSLEVTPKPDSIIRVLMEYKALDKWFDIKEQKLETPKRNGFVLVEWGGTELK